MKGICKLVIQQPKKFEFICNLKAADQIGVTIPPNVLGADGSSDPMTVLSTE